MKRQGASTNENDNVDADADKAAPNKRAKLDVVASPQSDESGLRQSRNAALKLSMYRSMLDEISSELIMLESTLDLFAASILSGPTLPPETADTVSAILQQTISSVNDYLTVYGPARKREE
ncbi:hypothetical protein BOX15_Mlig006890g2 [Macrostomum lignano]|uniref:Uncharacterized protein n=1 Tax=Macrostomum lignano TaxID=282301 RepID=A0A267H5Q4_9PLAT|nr:hypothetical protein BOX15_Mlig006890g2 [Macrostomum lignano]